MKKPKIIFLFIFLSLIYLGCSGNKESVLTNEINLVHNDVEQKVDVLVDGKLFTSYLYTDKLSVLKKTVLFPIVAANGAIISRGFPLVFRKILERSDSDKG